MVYEKFILEIIVSAFSTVGYGAGHDNAFSVDVACQFENSGRGRAGKVDS